MESPPVVVIGASAGGVEALEALVAALPDDLPAAVLVVLHVRPEGDSQLARILSRSGPLPAAEAQDGALLAPGRILVAAPDRHLLVQDGLVRVWRGPRENRHRPSIDPLFRSAAQWHGRRVVGVVLSGVLDDGAAGAALVAAGGGTVFVQHPADARFRGMPEAALNAVPVARAAPANALGALVAQAVEQVGSTTADGDTSQGEKGMTADSIVRSDAPGTPAALGCPECQGGMYEVTTGDALYYRCHVGHSWSPETLLEAQRHETEAALWNAASKLVEEASVHRRIAERQAGDVSHAADRADHLTAAERAEREAAVVSRLAERSGTEEEGMPSTEG